MAWVCHRLGVLVVSLWAVLGAVRPLLVVDCFEARRVLLPFARFYASLITTNRDPRSPDLNNHSHFQPIRRFRLPRSP